MFKICTKFPHVMVRLTLPAGYSNWNKESLQLLSLLTNVRRVVFNKIDDMDLAKMLLLCKNWTFLEKIKLMEV